MTRIEKNEDVEAQIAQAKTEVIQTVRATGRRGRLGIGCAVVFFAFILGFVLFAAWTVAATGLVRVPVFSSAAYRQPEPVRAVLPGVPLETSVSAEIVRVVTQRGREGRLDDRRITLRLTEASFTASLRSLMERSGVDAFDADRAQIAIDPDARLEFFLPFEDNAQRSAMRMRVDALAKDGALELRVVEVQVGSLVLPSFLDELLFGPLLRNNVAQFNREIGRYATLSGIRFEPGALVVDGELAAGIIEVPL
jgi:hypothetical protein